MLNSSQTWLKLPGDNTLEAEAVRILVADTDLAADMGLAGSPGKPGTAEVGHSSKDCKSG